MITTRRVQANRLGFTLDEAGEGDAVALCLHGFPESRFSWRHQLPALESAGWRAVAPDLRGYGDSEKPRGRAAYHLDHLVADVAALFDALGARRRLLVGHDWGAMVAWSFALRQALPLDGLVVMNVPHPMVFGQALRHSWAQRRRSWYVAAFQLPWLPEAILTAGHAWGVGQAIRGMAVDKAAFPDEVLDVYRTNALKPGAMTAMINYYRANADLGGGQAAAMIRTPILMIWGEQDKALGLELTEGYGPLVADFTLERLPGVSHWVQQEAPEQVNARLLAWLGRQDLSPTRCSPAGGAVGAAD
ncbi:alpha/beta fold hydrolase [Caulobacter sp. S45]|uniref:alpha/beta fold hydrolase n=1 Tax=Caulobacter sp. S45 TaxID=1641861 RepID=UPI0015770999|nr:alpha/beta hydrolase [Caulobacter sp. S45]